MPKPKWATPERQNHLVSLFLRSGGFCVFGGKPCTNPQRHHYEPFIEALIKDWIADDREARGYLLRLQRQALHRIPERGSLRGTFNAISRTIYHDNQPMFYVEEMGISGLTFRPFAKVRLASSYIRLHVDIGDVMKGLSKNRRRKAIRYSKALPVEAQRQVDTLCSRAVADHLR